jgi:starvation-inducible DNA-binding protein
MLNTTESDDILRNARPIVRQHGHETQPFGHLAKRPIALSESACRQSIGNLNQLLVDTFILRDLYKKSHWQVTGHTFHQLHVPFDRHAEALTALIDARSR